MQSIPSDGEDDEIMEYSQNDNFKKETANMADNNELKTTSEMMLYISSKRNRMDAITESADFDDILSQSKYLISLYTSANIFFRINKNIFSS